MKTIRKLCLCGTTLLLLLALLSPASHAAGTDGETALALTPEEKVFIQNHPVIYLGVDPTFVPYEFIDSDGQYKGIAADYIALIREKTGLQMEVVKGLTWSEAYEKAVKHEIDVLPCVAETAERERYFLFSDTYFTFQRAVFINETSKGINTFDDLSGKTVAVQMNSSHHSYMMGYPDIQLNLYPTVVDALKAVSDGKEIAFIGNLATSSYLAKSEGITNLKFFTIEAASNDKSQSLHFAVRKDWPELVGILNKALSSITKEEKTAINNKWIDVAETVNYSDIIRIVEIAGLTIVLIVVVSYFWIVRLRNEIAKRKKTQEELMIAKEEAEQANQVKSLFLTRMSHEIRTPLSAIMGMSYLIKKTELSTTQKVYLDKLTQAARNMLGTINDILDFSKIEAGKIVIERISFDLDKMLQRIINITSVKAEEQGIELVVDKDPDLPAFFWGDPQRIEQILLNLVNNAVKFTEKGYVSISVRVDTKEGMKERIAFTVTDTGIGISREQLDHLFVPFDQGDSSISRRFGGSGLGLSIVKSLTDLMGGEISVTSEMDIGTSFAVRLPLEIDSRPEQSRIKKMAADCFKNTRALIVDQNESTRNQLAEYFNSFGISTDLSMSEHDAPKMIHRASDEEGKPYNLIVVDFCTLAGDGMEYIRKIKNSPYSNPSCKYIAILPMTREDLYEDLEAAGIDLGITKPVISSVLYNGIIEIFNIIPPEPHRSMKNAEGQTQLAHYSILLVEDNKTNQFIAKTILEQAGLRVSLASNGEEGYRYYADHRNEIDLILMDLHMPVMDGYTASELIRKLDAEIPIVAMTADAIAGVEEKCQSHGIYAYVSKPFEPEQLIETISNLVKGRVSTESTALQTRGSDRACILDTEDGLKRIGGDQTVYRLVLQEFANENLTVGEELRKVITTGDFSAATQIVHKIKSSAGSIGAEGVHEVAAELQKSLQALDSAAIQKLHESFQTQLRDLLHTIKEYL